MNEKFDTLAKYALTSIRSKSLSDAAVHEFTDYCCDFIQNNVKADWDGSVAELWDYLTTCRTLPDNSLFRLGRLYTSLDMLRILQEKTDEECSLEEDARFYSAHWRKVFTTLGKGRSLTHRELATACELSDSSLSQFLRRIEEKNYIHYRKVGRTKYYRLSNKGQLLLKHMDSGYGLRKFSAFTFDAHVPNLSPNAWLNPFPNSEPFNPALSKGFQAINAPYVPFSLNSAYAVDHLVGIQAIDTPLTMPVLFKKTGVQYTHPKSSVKISGAVGTRKLAYNYCFNKK